MAMHVAMMRGVLFAGSLFLLAGAGARAADVSGEKGPKVRSAGTSTAGQTEEDQKAAWQKRMADARKQLLDAQTLKAQLEQKREKLKVEWAAPGSGRTNEEIDAELGRTIAEIGQAERDIAEATRLIEDVIPDEARKAGVPPGWLRD